MSDVPEMLRKAMELLAPYLGRSSINAKTLYEINQQLATIELRQIGQLQIGLQATQSEHAPSMLIITSEICCVADSSQEAWEKFQAGFASIGVQLDPFAHEVELRKRQEDGRAVYRIRSHNRLFVWSTVNRLADAELN